MARRSLQRLRLPLAWLGAGCLLVWAISLSGATGWSGWANWPLLIVGAALLALRAAAPARSA